MIGTWIDRAKSRLKSGVVWETEPVFSEGHRPAWLGDDQVRAVHESQDAAAFDPGVVGAGEVQVVTEPTTMYKAVREGIVTLTLPRGARVVVPAGAAEYYLNDLPGGKLRTDVAYVERVENLSGDELDRGHSIWSTRVEGYRDPFTYISGEWVQTWLDEEVSMSCSGGIHCFRSKHGARDWWEQSFW